MENIVVQLENDMWDAALKRNSGAFRKLASPDAVMICGGYKCLGAEYANYINEFDLTNYSISNMEVIPYGKDTVLLHYQVKTEVINSSISDLAGHFYVVSVWKKENEKWLLTFNMDSRIMQ